MGWISVKDKLPEERTEIIICTKHNEILLGYLINNKDLIMSNTKNTDKYSWKYIGTSVFGEQNQVTHWMPFPKPPKGELNEI